MTDKFEISLRTKSAEQLINMQQSKVLWNDVQFSLILKEIEKRGLEVFEEPEPWDENEMEGLDLLNPNSEFERDMSIITEFEDKEKSLRGVKLISQILSIAAVIITFSIYLFLPNFNIYLFVLSIACSMLSFGMLISKQYMIAIIGASIALALLVAMVLLELQELV